jgi:hypothetical protein
MSARRAVRHSEAICAQIGGRSNHVLICPPPRAILLPHIYGFDEVNHSPMNSTTIILYHEKSNPKDYRDKFCNVIYGALCRKELHGAAPTFTAAGGMAHAGRPAPHQKRFEEKNAQFHSEARAGAGSCTVGRR